MNDKKLYRSWKDRKVCGVCAGIGEYFNIDPTVIRMIWVVASLFGGGGLLAYIIGVVVIPDAPTDLSV